MTSPGPAVRQEPLMGVQRGLGSSCRPGQSANSHQHGATMEVPGCLDRSVRHQVSIYGVPPKALKRGVVSQWEYTYAGLNS